MQRRMKMVISNKFADALRPSGIREITSKLNEKTARGIKVTSFAGGMPAKEYFPLRELKEITDRLFDEEDGQIIQYAPSTGYEPLKKTLASFMSRYKVDTSVGNIQIYEGSTQALSYISRLFLSDNGGAVVVESPSYTGALDIFRMYNAEIIDVKTENDGFDLDELEKVLASKDVKFIYCIPDYQNPTGRVYSVEKRRKMVELAKKYDTVILEDSPYALLCFDGNLKPSIKSFDDEDERVIFIGSVSKIMAPGIRVGWTVGSRDFTQKMVYIKMIDDLQVNNLAQRQVFRYLTEYNLDAHLDEVREVYRRRRDLMVEAVRASFPEGTSVYVPEGGMFLWVDLPESVDTDKLFDVVFAHDIAYVPGSKFYSEKGKGTHSLRLNFATSNEEQIKQKVREMGQVITASIR